jgi:eukaryotic-like serine/threonine-protein kinase
MPGLSMGGYALVRTVAQGAMAELHLATDPTSGAPLALKTVHLGSGAVTRERFLREASAAARLRHPDIVRIYRAGVDETTSEPLGWIAMEWVTGSDLRRYATPRRLLPEPLALEIVARAADALALAHSRGVVHRDIKPSNLLVDIARGSVKITDFGCAQLSDLERSRSGLMIGSPAYMAPEQLAGALVDGRSDLYALGVVLFELLTGRLPFAADNLGLLLAAIAREPAPALSALRPDLPSAWSDLLAVLLAKTPAERPADGHVMARQLRALATQALPHAPGRTTAQPP